MEDNGTVTIEYTAACAALSTYAGIRGRPRDEFRIRGTEGELDLTPLNGASLVHPGGMKQIRAHANLHYPCIEDFVSAIVEGRQLRASGVTALDAEWVMDEARISARQERSRPARLCNDGGHQE